MTYDAIIIGSGLGGLASGVILSKAGMKVCVLERSNQIGGCLQSYRRGGLPYETGLHYVGGLEVGQPLYEAFHFLGLDTLPWHKMDECFDRIIIQENAYAIAQGADNFVETLAADFPHQRQQLQTFAQRLVTSDMEDAKINAWQYLHDTFQDERLIQVLSGTALRMELRKESLPLFCLTHAMRSYVQSSWRLHGDGNMMTSILASQITDQGGTIRCNCEVTGLNGNGTEITEVLCNDGSAYSAKYVISDIHPTLLGKLMEDLPGVKKVFLMRMNNIKNTYGIFTTSLRLKPEQLPYLNHNAFVYDTPDVWTLVEDNEPLKGVMISYRIPEDGGSHAQQIDLLTPVKWEEFQPWEQTKVGRRGKDYTLFCQHKAEESIRLAEHYVPGLGAAVDKIYTSTPLTYRDYLNIPQGSAFGMRKEHMWSHYSFISPRTHMSNLFLTGQNLALPGIEGVIKTAFISCSNILGTTYGIKL